MTAKQTKSVFAAGEQSLDIGLAGQETIARTVSLTPPSTGNVIVTASAFVANASPGAVSVRCTITTGTANEPGFFHIVTVPGAVSFAWATIGGTRGFTVTGGVTFTVNYVCDQATGEVQLRNSSLTAVFTPG